MTMIYMMRVRNEVEAFADLVAEVYGPMQAAAMDRDLIAKMVVTDVLGDACITIDELHAMDEEEQVALFDRDLFEYINIAIPTGCHSIINILGWQVVLRPGLTDVYCVHGSAVDVLRDATMDSFRQWVADCGEDYRRHHCAYTCK